MCRENLHDSVHDKIAETRTWAVEAMTKLSEKFGGGPGECHLVSCCCHWLHESVAIMSVGGGGGGVRGIGCRVQTCQLLTILRDGCVEALCAGCIALSCAALINQGNVDRF